MARAPGAMSSDARRGLGVMIDLHPAAQRTSNLITAVVDEQLDVPTPCPRSCLGDLVDHVGMLADAWQDPQAWEGSTRAGGIEMPAAVVGLVALDELIVHGWDIAVATGQTYEPPSREIAAATAFVTSFDAPRDGTLFGPVVPVADDATQLDRLLGQTGRDPSWQRPY
jgi:hypothetical protein